jgi:Arc/MetJ-type ribon-helix-helix transcriptional regulator
MTQTRVKTPSKKVRMTFTLPQETAKAIKQLIKEANYSQYVNNLISKDLASKQSENTFKQIHERMKQNKGGIVIENKEQLEQAYEEMGLR